MQRILISALVTNCSARKSVPSAPGLAFGDVIVAPQPAVASQWVAAASRAPALTRACDLYLGRGVKRMRRLAEQASADLYIASAGLGLLRADDKVPSYDLSVSAGTPSAVQGLVSSKFSAQDWWSALQKSRYATPIVEVFDRNEHGLILIAVSNSYVSLLAEELSALNKTHRDRLRLFGAVDSKYPTNLRALTMPYDARLDALICGSKLDFAQRATEHFVRGILSGDAFPSAIDDQCAWVKAALDNVVAKPVAKRQVVDDARIRALAEKLAAQGLSHTRALSVLRQQHGVACERSRFRRLFREATT